MQKHRTQDKTNNWYIVQLLRVGNGIVESAVL